MVVLYILEHKLGLKYFGKTTRYFTEQDIFTYGGSGTYWKKYLNKHGKDFTVKILGKFSFEEVEDIALKFSKENDIVNSKEWANLIYENGLDGGNGSSGRKPGFSVSEETKKKMSESHKGKKLSKEHIEKIIHSNKTRIVSDDTKKKISESKKGKGIPKSVEHKRKLSESLKGRKMTDEQKKKLKKPKKRIECPHCGKIGGAGNMKRYHFNNCKYITQP